MSAPTVRIRAECVAVPFAIKVFIGSVSAAITCILFNCQYPEYTVSIRVPSTDCVVVLFFRHH
jgi:hypothetical protein